MRQSFFIAVLLLIAVKVALWVSLGPAAIVGDAHGYWDLSSLVIDGDAMMMREPIAFRTPVYPWFLDRCRASNDVCCNRLAGRVAGSENIGSAIGEVDHGRANATGFFLGDLRWLSRLGDIVRIFVDAESTERSQLRSERQS